MIIVKIVGGLGNQMFQYAYAKKLQSIGFNVKIDLSAFVNYKLHGGYQLDKYNIDLLSSNSVENNRFYKNNLFSKILKKFPFVKTKIVKEKSLLFDSMLLEVSDDKYVEGYFQNERYLSSIENEIRNNFSIISPLTSFSSEIKNMILNSESSCSIHIRRGDFANKENKNIHGTCDLEYYTKAIKKIESQYDKTYFFVFSDDFDWVKKNLNIKNVTYVNCKEKRIPHEDIYLMSLCQNNIIANSSFSWWGAWLNNNSNKTVIAPSKWFKDELLEKQSRNIVCESWIKI